MAAAQAEARIAVDAIMERFERRFQKLLTMECQEMLFALMMTEGLSDSQIRATRDVIKSFQSERAIANQTAVAIRRRHINNMLKDLLPPLDKPLRRWSRI